MLDPPVVTTAAVDEDHQHDRNPTERVQTSQAGFLRYACGLHADGRTVRAELGLRKGPRSLDQADAMLQQSEQHVQGSGNQGDRYEGWRLN